MGDSGVHSQFHMGPLLAPPWTCISLIPVKLDNFFDGRGAISMCHHGIQFVHYYQYREGVQGRYGPLTFPLFPHPFPPPCLSLYSFCFVKAIGVEKYPFFLPFHSFSLHLILSLPPAYPRFTFSPFPSHLILYLPSSFLSHPPGTTPTV